MRSSGRRWRPYGPMQQVCTMGTHCIHIFQPRCCITISVPMPLLQLRVMHVSSQCTPTVDHRSTQTGNVPSICNCNCALEVSQLKQEVLDMKVHANEKSVENHLQCRHVAIKCLHSGPCYTCNPSTTTYNITLH